MALGCSHFYVTLGKRRYIVFLKQVKTGKSKINALTDKSNEKVTGAPGTVGSSIVDTYMGNPANARGKVDHKNINKRPDSFGESFGE